MSKFINTIILEILEFIYREGGDPKTWYIGVTNDPRIQLFDEHQVHYENDSWIYRTATSEGEALQVQSYFLDFGLASVEKEWQPGDCVAYVYRKDIGKRKALSKAQVSRIGRRLRARHT